MYPKHVKNEVKMLRVNGKNRVEGFNGMTSNHTMGGHTTSYVDETLPKADFDDLITNHQVIINPIAKNVQTPKAFKLDNDKSFKRKLPEKSSKPARKSAKKVVNTNGIFEGIKRESNGFDDVDAVVNSPMFPSHNTYLSQFGKFTARQYPDECGKKNARTKTDHVKHSDSIIELSKRKIKQEINSLSPTPPTKPSLNRLPTKWHAPQPNGMSLVDTLSLSDSDNSLDDHQDVDGFYDDLISGTNDILLAATAYPDNANIDRESNIVRQRAHLIKLLKFKQKILASSQRKLNAFKLRLDKMDTRKWSSTYSVLKNRKCADWLAPRRTKNARKMQNITKKIQCSYESGMKKCFDTALPCTKHCPKHILHNPDQVLFRGCAARYVDNSQCCAPVLDPTREQSLCAEHARKQGLWSNERLDNSLPKKSTKRKPTSAARGPRKTKKRKKEIAPVQNIRPSVKNVTSTMSEIIPATRQTGQNARFKNKNIPEIETDELQFGTVELPDDMVAQVLGETLELNGPAEALATQASHLLEESELTNVLSQITSSDFSELLATVTPNSTYIPTREETEELERALEAVNLDVKSLVSQNHNILDSFIDEHVLVESLSQIPDVFTMNGLSNMCATPNSNGLTHETISTSSSPSSTILSPNSTAALVSTLSSSNLNNLDLSSMSPMLATRNTPTRGHVSRGATFS